MANRTTAELVKEVMDSTLSNIIVESYIDVANTVITDTLGTKGLTDVKLEHIERWYTAHMISVARERAAISETIGDASIKYAGYYKMGLEASPYGQMVLQLDTTGTLAALGKRAVKILAIEKQENE